MSSTALRAAPVAATQALDRAVVLDGADALMQLRERLGCGSELGRNRDRACVRYGSSSIE